MILSPHRQTEFEPFKDGLLPRLSSLFPSLDGKLLPGWTPARSFVGRHPITAGEIFSTECGTTGIKPRAMNLHYLSIHIAALNLFFFGGSASLRLGVVSPLRSFGLIIFVAGALGARLVVFDTSIPGDSASFPSKWISDDGLTMHLVFSSNDSFSVRRAQFILAQP
jgi:hypothetical protein